MKRIHEEDKQVWYSISLEQMGTELLRMKQSLEKTFDISKKMAEDPKCEDRIEWLNCMNDSRLSIIHLLSEYPDFITRRNSGESTELGNEIKPYVKRVHSLNEA